jgi:hypothetical protein
VDKLGKTGNRREYGIINLKGEEQQEDHGDAGKRI